MKVIIQIPCFNEREHLPLTLSELPKGLAGADSVEYLVIDDGSTDGTAEAAREAGAHHVVELGSHQGLARGFLAGVMRCLELDADIIVNTDADNQYDARDIQKLIDPILSGRAGMVIGVRPVQDIRHFSYLKKKLNRMGSRFVSRLADMKIEDAPSGFRAFSRECVLKMNIFSGYTYTMESIIQARFKDIRIETTPVRTNEKLRESRLITSNLTYIARSIKTILRIFMIYNPTRVFARLSAIFFAAGLVLGARFLYYYFTEGGSGHIQSLILLSVFFTLGLGSALVSVFCDLISVNRKLSEDIQYRLKKIELGIKNDR